MDLPTYTNIWRIEKRLYKLYDFRLPMPLPINWIAVFAGITIPYIVLLIAIGLPFNHTLVWLYVLPPGVLTWLTTRPVIENKRLPELVESQVRYFTEPRTWVRLTPLSEKDQMALTARVWHSRPRPQAPARRPVPAARQLPAAEPERQVGPLRPMPEPVLKPTSVFRPEPGQAVVQGQPVRERERSGAPQRARAQERGRGQERFRVRDRSRNSAAGQGTPRRAPELPSVRAVPPPVQVIPVFPAAGPERSGPPAHAIPDVIPSVAAFVPQSGPVQTPPPASGPPADAQAPAGLPGPPSAPATGQPVRARAGRSGGPGLEVSHDGPRRRRGAGQAPSTPVAQSAPTARPSTAAPSSAAPSFSGAASTEAAAPVTAPSAPQWPSTPLTPPVPPVPPTAPVRDWPVPARPLRPVPAAPEEEHSAPAGPDERPAPVERSVPSERPAPVEPSVPAERPAQDERTARSAPDERLTAEGASGAETSAETNMAATTATPAMPAAAAATPDVAVPDVAVPVVAAPGAVASDSVMPDSAVPDFAVPGVGVPGAVVPDGAMPDSAAPDFAVPGVAVPGAVVPDGAVPDSAAPDFAVPGAVVPDVAMPNGAKPDVAMPDVAGAASPALASSTPDGAGLAAGLADVPQVPPAAARPTIQAPPIVTPAETAVQAPAATAAAPAAEAVLAAPLPAPAAAAPAPAAPAPAPAPKSAQTPAPPASAPAPPPAPTVQRVEHVVDAKLPSIERALSGPARDMNSSWGGKVKVVVTGNGATQGPGARDQEVQDRHRARLPISEPRRVLVLGCTSGAGQSVTTLMTASMLASLREHPVAAVDLHDGTLARYRAPAAWLEELLAGKPPQHIRPTRPDGLHPTPKPSPARLDVVASHEPLTDGDEIKLAVQLNRHYPLTLLDPGAAGLTRLLKVTDQLVVVVPANVDAAGALADTRDWLDNNGHADLAMQSVTVINGVSRRSLPDVESAEAIARGRSRAIVRVPWDDMLPVSAASPSTLRPQTRVAYTALAGVLVAGLAAAAVRKKP